jgi:hypothetical protein
VIFINTDLSCPFSTDGSPEGFGPDVAKHLVWLGLALGHLHLVQVAHHGVDVVMLVQVKTVLHLS